MVSISWMLIIIKLLSILFLIVYMIYLGFIICCAFIFISHRVSAGFYSFKKKSILLEILSISTILFNSSSENYNLKKKTIENFSFTSCTWCMRAETLSAARDLTWHARTGLSWSKPLQQREPTSLSLPHSCLATPL